MKLLTLSRTTNSRAIRQDEEVEVGPSNGAIMEDEVIEAGVDVGEVDVVEAEVEAVELDGGTVTVQEHHDQAFIITRR